MTIQNWRYESFGPDFYVLLFGGFIRLESVYNFLEVIHLFLILLVSKALLVVAVITLYSLSLLRWLDPQWSQLVAP